MLSNPALLLCNIAKLTGQQPDIEQNLIRNRILPKRTENYLFAIWYIGDIIICQNADIARGAKKSVIQVQPNTLLPKIVPAYLMTVSVISTV